MTIIADLSSSGSCPKPQGLSPVHNLEAVQQQCKHPALHLGTCCSCTLTYSQSEMKAKPMNTKNVQVLPTPLYSSFWHHQDVGFHDKEEVKTRPSMENMEKLRCSSSTIDSKQKQIHKRIKLIKEQSSFPSQLYFNCFRNTSNPVSAFGLTLALAITTFNPNHRS